MMSVMQNPILSGDMHGVAGLVERARSELEE